MTDLVNEVADSRGEIGVPMTRTDNGFGISGSGVPVFGDVALMVPDGARVVWMTVEGDRLVVHIQGAG